jgi:hypothetical protein
MAIIRIKRTTSSNLPTGLTFGEMAFVQGGGYTANRLYIADNAGVCIWIGGQILNSPTYWSGATAETTVPTVSAVRSALIAGGAITFASDLSVNISAGKYFGKYTRGETIPAQGQTVKWVIEDALNEVIAPTISCTPSGTVSFGQTTGSLSISVGYTIKTAGASAAGSTLEFRYGTGTWTTLSSALKDDTKGTDQAYSNSYTHNTWDRSSDAESGGGYSTTAFNYRYTVHDTFGASASATGTINPTGVQSASISITGVTAASLRTGVLGAPSGTETNSSREKGNTATTVTFTINRASGGFVPITNYVLQAQELVNNSYGGGWTTVKSEAISGNPSSVSRGLTYTVSASGASLDRLQFRVRVNDAYNNTVGTTTDSSTSTVNFDYMVFFGATTNVPTSSTDIRGLSSGIIAGNPATFGSGGGGSGIANPFTGMVGGSNNKFILALPDSVTPTTIVDSETNGNVVSSFVLSSTITTVNDRSGSAKNYNVYIMDNTNPYNDNRTHTVTRTGSVSQP